MSAEFDRIRRRATATAPTARDPQGKRAIFSTDVQQAAFGTASVECSSCHQTTAVTMRQLARLAVPSLHLPVLRRRFPSWLRCPACQRRTWVRLRVEI